MLKLRLLKVVCTCIFILVVCVCDCISSLSFCYVYLYIINIIQPLSVACDWLVGSVETWHGSDDRWLVCLLILLSFQTHSWCCWVFVVMPRSRLINSRFVTIESFIQRGSKCCLLCGYYMRQGGYTCVAESLR